MSHFDPNPVSDVRPKRVALVISNPATSPNTGWPVGFWWSELSHPYFAFQEVGYQVDVFSPRGGACVADTLSDPRDQSGYSRGDLISLGFLSTPELVGLVEQTKPASGIEPGSYDALVVAGGQAPMITFEHEPGLASKVVEFFEAGKVVAALCHGTAVLRYAKLSGGEALVKGRTVTGFSNAEEDFADEAAWSYGMLERGTSIMPWRIEDELNALGANFVHAGLWRPFAVRDGNLVTGQQNFSGLETARLVIEALGR